MQNRVFDRVMQKEIRVGNVPCRIIDVLFVCCALALAFFVRWPLMPIQSGDYGSAYAVWMEQIRQNGGFRALGMEISDYNSPYMYLLCILTYISSNHLYALKLLTVLFDYAAAVLVLLLVYRLTGNVRRAIWGMTFLLFSPAVVIDGAYWAQCDMIYAAFILAALYFLFQKNSRLCLICTGLAFSFKLQALFIVPFLLILWSKKETILLRHFLWIPAVYVITEIPAWLMGRSWKDLLLIYVNQTGSFTWGTLEYPNLYALMGEAMPEMHYAAEVSGAGLILTFMVLGGIAYYVYTKNVRFTHRMMVSLALFTVGLTVYTLPHMHERYGILLDLLALLYAMLDVRKLPLYIGFSVVSVVSFMPFLIGVHIFPVAGVSIALLGLLLYVGYDFYRQVRENTVFSAEIQNKI